jgi:pimeloyl-ACP methyl ester carboxylesterase
VEGLIAVDGRFSRPPASLQESAKRDAETRQRAARYREPGFRNLVAPVIDSMFGAKTTPAMRREIKSVMMAAPQKVVADAVESMGAFARLMPPKITVPVLAIYARRPGDSPEAEAWVRTFVQDLDWQVWDGVAHFLMMEEPERFNRTVGAFLDRVAKSGG